MFLASAWTPFSPRQQLPDTYQESITTIADFCQEQHIGLRQRDSRVLFSSQIRKTEQSLFFPVQLKTGE